MSKTEKKTAIPKLKAKVLQTVQCQIVDLECKVDEQTGEHTLEGHLAVFGNVDAQRERIIRGAFKKTINDNFGPGKRGIPMMVKHAAHGGDVKESVGTFREAREDAKGLWVKGFFDSTQSSQDVFTKVNEKHVNFMSIGYFTIRDAFTDDGIRDLLEIAAVEGTLTLFPANGEASITGSKTDAAAVLARLETIEKRLEIEGADTQDTQDKNAGNTEAEAGKTTAEPSAVSTDLVDDAHDLWVMGAKTTLERIQNDENIERTTRENEGTGS